MPHWSSDKSLATRESVERSIERTISQGVQAPGLVQKLFGRPAIRHNALLLTANVAIGAANFLLHPVLKRLLGVSAYGTFASLLAVQTILLIPVGILLILVARYASTYAAQQRLDRLNDLVRRLTRVFLLAGIAVALLLAIGSAPLSGFFQLQSSQALLILALSFVVAFASQVNLGAVQGMQRFGWFAVLTAMPAVSRLVFGATLALLGLGVNGAVWGLTLAAACQYAASFQPLRGLLGGTRGASEPFRSMIAFSTTTTLALACLTLLFNLDTVLAKHYLDGRDAGLYAAVAVLGKTSLFVTGSVVTVMFPRVTALHARGERTSGVALQSLAAVAALAGLAELAFAIVPAPIMRLLFGGDMVAVAGQLAWYGLAMLFLALSQALISYFIAVGSRRYVVAPYVCCPLMVLLIVVHHQSVADIVRAVVVANGLLCATLMVFFLLVAGQEKVPLLPALHEAPPPEQAHHDVAEPSA
jgi:O-antigen/teichoic acid export membrane protein